MYTFITRWKEMRRAAKTAKAPWPLAESVDDVYKQFRAVAAEKKIKKACDKRNIPMIAFANARNMQRRIEEKQRILMIGGDYDLDSRISGSLDYLRKNMPGMKVGTSK